jgi:hypothetical protein
VEINVVNGKGIIAADERLDVENARLAELSSQLVQIQAISSESGSRQQQAQGASGDRMQEVLNNPLIGGLKADLTRSRESYVRRERAYKTRIDELEDELQRLAQLDTEAAQQFIGER